MTTSSKPPSGATSTSFGKLLNAETADRRLILGLFLLLAALFYVANHGAFRGYFQDDDIDNLAMTRQLEWKDFIWPLAIPKVFDNNFRPVGHLYYRVMGQVAHLQYTPYIATIHMLHLLNVALLWLIVRRIGIPWFAACAGALFWAFHMAVFDVFWKPMYVFDLLCGMFCLISLLLYVNGRWLAALLAMWLGYRGKEVAIMLPVVLAAYQLLLGDRKCWKRLLPFFALSLVLGVQALIQNPAKGGNAYTLQFTPEAIWECIRFYAGEVFLVPFAGLAILLLLFTRDRKIIFGVVGFCALLFPMLVLPGRLFGAYLYTPLIGLSIAVAGLAAKVPPSAVVLFFVAWLPWNYIVLKRDRNLVLSNANDRRVYVARMAAFARRFPDMAIFVVNQGPYNTYGTAGAIKIQYAVHAGVRVLPADDPVAPEIMRSAPEAAVLNWDSFRHDLGIVVKRPDTPDAGFIRMGLDTPIWQFEKGWFEHDGLFRWIEPVATARLGRPAGARHFQIVVNAGGGLLERLGTSHLEVLVNGQSVGTGDVRRNGLTTFTWEVPDAPPGPAEVEIRVSPEFRAGNRVLGIAVVAFGFV